MFSPRAATARRRGLLVDPYDYAAVNVALVRGGRRLWTFTERGRGHVAYSADALSIGQSRIECAGGELRLELCERAVPGLRRVRGRIRIFLDGQCEEEYALDSSARHFWSPIAPCARIEVDFERPRLAWRGRAYVDSNRGLRPLESDFRRWHWSRSELSDGRTAVFYDPDPRAGPACARALIFDRDGTARPIEAPPLVAVDRSRWGVDRAVRSEPGARVVRTLEDSPFYARSLIETRFLGATTLGIHESLDLGRFTRPWVQALIPFRAPRVA